MLIRNRFVTQGCNPHSLQIYSRICIYETLKFSQE